MSLKESLDSIAEFIGGTRKDAFSLWFRDDIYASLDEISHEDLKILVEVDPEIQEFFKLLDEKFSDDVNRLSIEEKIKAYFIFKDHQEDIEYLESCSKGFFHKFSFKLASEMAKKDFSRFLYYKIFENSSVSDVSSFIEDVVNQDKEAMTFYNQIQLWEDSLCDISKSTFCLEKKLDKNGQKYRMIKKK